MHRDVAEQSKQTNKKKQSVVPIGTSMLFLWSLVFQMPMCTCFLFNPC